MRSKQRPISLLITPFSNNESALADSIDTLMDAVTQYKAPNAEKAAFIVQSAIKTTKIVTTICKSGIECVSQIKQYQPLDYGSKAIYIYELNMLLGSSNIQFVEKVKTLIHNDVLHVNKYKNDLFQNLIGLANLANGKLISYY